MGLYFLVLVVGALGVFAAFLFRGWKQDWNELVTELVEEKKRRVEAEQRLQELEEKDDEEDLVLDLLRCEGCGYEAEKGTFNRKYVDPCPGNVFCPECERELDGETGNVAQLCGDCVACQHLKEAKVFDAYVQERAVDRRSLLLKAKTGRKDPFAGGGVG